MKDAKQRYTPDDVLCHRWMREDAPKTPLQTPDVLLRSVFAQFLLVSSEFSLSLILRTICSFRSDKISVCDGYGLLCEKLQKAEYHIASISNNNLRGYLISTFEIRFAAVLHSTLLSCVSPIRCGEGSVRRCGERELD